MAYVDKTQGIADLVADSGCFFLSRPRRFGKSLLVSTLKCLWEGRRELFEGLWIGEGDRWHWEPHPVVMIDFNGLAVGNPEELRISMEDSLNRKAGDAGLTLSSRTISGKFEELILGLAKSTGRKVVLLVDEYDRPIVHHLGQDDKAMAIAREHQKLLREFFVVLKDAEVASKLRWAFMTGISRFSKLSVFSALNQFQDISLNGAYATLIGITEPEIDRYFEPYLKKMCADTGRTQDQLLADLRAFYNGYRFVAGGDQVYNPFSSAAVPANPKI